MRCKKGRDSALFARLPLLVLGFRERVLGYVVSVNFDCLESVRGQSRTPMLKSIDHAMIKPLQSFCPWAMRGCIVHCYHAFPFFALIKNS